MHPNDTHDRFVDLRVQGLSLSRIAEQLNLSKRTLVDWNRQHQDEISALRTLELEALHDRILGSYEDQLARLSTLYTRLEDHLAGRDFRGMDTDKILRMALLVRKELRQLRADVKPVSKPQPATPPALAESTNVSQPALRSPRGVGGPTSTSAGPATSSRSVTATLPPESVATRIPAAVSTPAQDPPSPHNPPEPTDA